MTLWSELDELVPFRQGVEEHARGQADEVGAAVEVVPFTAAQLARNERFARSLVKNNKVRRRRGFPIIGYIGDNGSGKTLAAVRDTVPTLLAGGRVMSATPLYDPLAKYPRALHPNYVPLRSWREVVYLRDADLLLDEVQSVANARQATSIPPQLLTAFLQLRKRGVVLRWTTTHWTRLDSALREVTKAAVICSSSLPSAKAGADGWRPKRLFRARLVDAATLDGAYTIQLGDERPEMGVRTLSSERYLRRDWWPWLYDSTALVEVLDHVDASGWCMTCGGHRVRAKCSCGSH